MNVAILQKEIEQLPDHLQDRLAAFLTALRLNRSGEDQEIFSRLDDPVSENWQSWSQVKEELPSDDSSAE